MSRDFSLAGNPHGAWSYGWKSAFSADFVLLGTAKTNIAENGIPMEVWAINPYSVPAVLHNATSSTGTSDGGQAMLPPEVIWYYPGPEGTPHHFGIIRFTVPNGGEGTYRIHTSVAPVYNLTQGDTDFHVLQNGVAIYGINLAGQATGQYASELALASGDTVEFAIGRGADNSYHYSGLKIEATLDLISTNPVPPSIVSQPQSQTVTEGSTVTLTVVANGSAPLSYQWSHNGAVIDGAVTASLLLNSVQSGQAGEYSVTVSNAYGGATSEVAVLTVNPAPPQADYDLSRDFSPAGNPNGAWSYGWKSALSGEYVLLGTSKINIADNGVPMEVWAINSYSVPAVLHNATSSTGTSDGGQAILPPGVTWYYPGPEGTPHHFGIIRFTVPNGGEGTYRIHTSVAPVYNLTQGDTDFHVLQNGVAIYGINLAGQATGQYASELALASGDTVEFAIGRGADNSYHYSGLKIEATLDLSSTNPVPPGIVTQPQSQTADLGATVTLGIGVTGSLPLTYRWQFDGADIPGGTNSTLVLEFVQTSQAGDYQVFVSNAYGSATSEVATVTVHSTEVAPTINSQPVGGQVMAGSTFTLRVGALGTAPLSYQWFYNGSSIPGGTFSSLVLSNVQSGHSGTYFVTVTNAFGSATSRGAVVNVIESTQGGAVLFRNGPGNLIYDVDGTTPLPAGSQYLAQLYGGPDAGSLQPVGAAAGFLAPGRFFSGTRIITSVPGLGVATVQVRVWESAYGTTYEQALAAGGKTGASSIFTVTTGGGSPPLPPPDLAGLQSFSLMPGAGATPPTITSHPASQTVLLGQSASFAVAASGSALLYQWWFNGADVVGATGASLSITNAGNADAGDYVVVVRNNGGAVTSEVARLTVETERLLATEDLGPAAEGEAVAVPIHLISRGDVGGMIFVLRYNPDYLSAPEVSWGSVLEGALKESNETALGELRFVFAFGSATVPAGTQSLAVVNLRARSVIENVASQLGLQIIDVSDAAGNPVIHGSAAESGSVGILSTSSLEGDNNGNGRLDIGDATLVLRLLALLDTTRPWDVAQNDLNNNGILDSGDAIKIIRAAAGIGAPPAPPAGFAARSKGLAAAFSSIAGSATLFPGTLQGNPGSLVTVQVRLQGVTSPIAGASFTVNYPANVLRFRGAHDHRAGIIVPRNSSPAWNVSPGENNYSTQDGQLRFAVSSSTSWAANNGVIAELTFKVQNPPAAEFSWPIALSNVEITPDGYELDALASAGAAFTTLPVLGGMSRSPGGSFTFNFEAGGIGSFEVQVSTNLRDWVTLTNVVNASGSVLISDRNAAQFPQRFYRTRIE